MTTKIKMELKKVGAKNLREFGYPDCNENNIMEVFLFKQFFKRMLQNSLGQISKETDIAVNELLEEINREGELNDNT